MIERLEDMTPEEYVKQRMAHCGDEFFEHLGVEKGSYRPEFFTITYVGPVNRDFSPNALLLLASEAMERKYDLTNQVEFCQANYKNPERGIVIVNAFGWTHR